MCAERHGDRSSSRPVDVRAKATTNVGVLPVTNHLLACVTVRLMSVPARCYSELLPHECNTSDANINVLSAIIFQETLRGYSCDMGELDQNLYYRLKLPGNHCKDSCMVSRVIFEVDLL